MSEPVAYEYSQRVYIQGFKIYIPKYPEVNYGDYLSVEGMVEDKELKDVKNVVIVESTSVLFSLRNRLLSFYEQTLPNPHAALIAGVTIGSKKNISSSFYEVLKASGTLHVVVASGMNVTLVAGFLINALVLLVKRGKAIMITLIGIWMYALLSGFDAPIVRAAIMGSIAFSAQELGRVNSAWRGLVLSALIMILIKPEWIVDLGFILSFVATASLMLFEERIEKVLKFVPLVFRENLSTSLAAQIGVAPILLVTFGQFNPLSPVINALVLWTIAPITIIGMIGGILGLIFVPLGRLVLYLSYPLTSVFIAVVKFFG